MSGTGQLLEELHLRGLVQDCTDEQGLYAHLLKEKATGYVGFDPTIDSLTVGHLIPLAVLRLFQRAGHEPIVLMGGGTGLIGDPTGKTLERPLLGEDEVEANIGGQRAIIQNFFVDSAGQPRFVDNREWLSSFSLLDALRGPGRHLSAFSMFQRDSVRSRRESGMTYTEFSYQFLQALDFAHLRSTHEVSVQFGGSDQWGNMVAGLELMRRGGIPGEAFALTSPLHLDRDGQKMGKSALTSVWLSSQRTSPYDLYQYFFNLSDDVAGELWLKVGDEPIGEIQAQLDEWRATPAVRGAQIALGVQVLDTLYGPGVRRRCQSAATAMFSGKVKELSPAEIQVVVQNLPLVGVRSDEVFGSERDAVSLAVVSGLANSRAEARRLISSGGVSMNGEVLTFDRVISRDDLLAGRLLLLRRGNKSWRVVEVTA